MQVPELDCSPTRPGAAVRVTAPEWFVEALSAKREQRFVTVSGCQISYWRWGNGGRPGLVLVHGGGAHGRWWDHVAPFLVTPGRSVVAVDLSGHGDSDHRESYNLREWGEEMMAVARHAELEGPTVLAGHSLGGWSTVVAAGDHSDEVGGLILMDCRIIDPEPGEAGAPQPVPPPRPPRLYPTQEEILRRYRPEPAQDGNLPFVMDHLARTSVRAVEGGWTWKFDPRALYQSRPGTAGLGRVRCPVSIVRGDRGLVTPTITQGMCRSLGGPVPVVDVPLAGHHLMLDQPLLLVTALRAVLAAWTADGM